MPPELQGESFSGNLLCASSGQILCPLACCRPAAPPSSGYELATWRDRVAPEPIGSQSASVARGGERQRRIRAQRCADLDDERHVVRDYTDRSASQRTWCMEALIGMQPRYT